MANARRGNVIRVDTSADFLDVRDIVAIKYIGNTSGTGKVHAGSSSGTILWEESGTANVHNQVCIYDNGGIHVAVTNSAVVYIYTK